MECCIFVELLTKHKLLNNMKSDYKAPQYCSRKLEKQVSSFLKIENTIDSISNLNHLDSVTNMIELYTKRHPGICTELLVHILNARLHNKINQLQDNVQI
jgi:hypothetical protein